MYKSKIFLHLGIKEGKERKGCGSMKMLFPRLNETLFWNFPSLGLKLVLWRS
jgi:hypothetical protein